MKAEYTNQLRNMRIQSASIIREADANPGKWYEMYVDQGDTTGTHTVASGDTFDQAVRNYQTYADQYGLGNLHIDIWENRQTPCQISGVTHPAITPELVEISFHIQSGYAGGGDYPGMSKEKTDVFFAEIRTLFTEAGFDVQPNKHTDCPQIIKENTSLYCHPQQLSGYCEKNHIPAIEAILAKAATFTHQSTHTYNPIYPYTHEQETEYYRQVHGPEIEKTLLTAFTTKRRNKYKPQREILDLIANRFRIQTIHHFTGASFDDPCFNYIREVYNQHVGKGTLIESEKQIGTCKIKLCRSANTRERRKLNP